MSGIVLDRSEFVVLMDAVEAGDVVGIDAAQIVPQDEAQHKALLESGLERLKARGALRTIDDVNILDIDLLSMALLVANPEAAVITTRDNPGLGQQLFLHYAAGDVIVEQTLPDTTHHRWALVAGQTGLAERLLGILPAKAGGAPVSVKLAQADFLEVKRLSESHQAKAAQAILARAGLSGAGADELIDALARPAFGGTVAVLAYRGGEVVDGRNLAMVQGRAGAYSVTPLAGDPEIFEIVSTDEPKLRSLLINWLAELSTLQN